MTVLLTGRVLALIGLVTPVALKAQSYPIRKMARPPACDSASAGARKVALCNDALARKPDSLRVRLTLADEHLREGRWSEATREFQTASSIDPSSANPYRDSLVALLTRKQFDRALAAMSPESTWYLRAGLQPITAALVKGKALRSLGRDGAATSVLQRAEYLPQMDARVYLELGDAYAKMGRREQALAAYQTVLSRTDDSTFGARAWGAMARVSASSGRPAIASAYWEKALRLDPTYFASREEEAMMFRASQKGTGVSKPRAPQRDSTKRGQLSPSRPPEAFLP